MFGETGASANVVPTRVGRLSHGGASPDVKVPRVVTIAQTNHSRTDPLKTLPLALRTAYLGRLVGVVNPKQFTNPGTLRIFRILL